jgi:hypothetical protein
MESSMRHVFLTAAFLLIGGSAMASSFLPINEQTRTSGHSIETKVCASCPPIKPAVAKKDYVVPELPIGTQTTVVRDVNGEQKVVRTEAWLGGSPVVFISNASPEALAAAGAPTDGVDLGAKTAALPGTGPAPKPIDTSAFQLRLQ